MSRRRQYGGSELHDHMVIAQALMWWAHPDVWWTHFPSGEYRAGPDGAKLKCMGLKPGVPDFLFFHASRPGVAWWIEYKPEKGRLSEDQKQVRDDFERIGINHSVAYGKDQMARMLRSIEAFDPAREKEAAEYILTTKSVGARFKNRKREAA